jgi:hypothetical protein
MSRNGSGIYNLPTGNPVVTGTTITSNWANTTLSDISTALTGSLASDGQTPVTGDIQMGGNKITGLGTPTVNTDGSTKGYVDSAIATATGSLGTMSTQNANNVAITGGTITGLSSALPVASGGTGVTTSTGTGATVRGTSPTIATPTISSPTITGTVSDGTISTSSTTIIAGAAKAWVQFNSSGGVVGSYNVSSVTNNSTGLYTVNFTNAMANGNYAAVACPVGTNNLNVMTYSFGTTSFQIYCQVGTSAAYSNMAVAATVFS